VVSLGQAVNLVAPETLEPKVSLGLLVWTDSTAWLEPKDRPEPQVTVSLGVLVSQEQRVRREREGRHTLDSLASRGAREREDSKGVLG